MMKRLPSQLLVPLQSRLPTAAMVNGNFSESIAADFEILSLMMSCPTFIYDFSFGKLNVLILNL